MSTSRLDRLASAAADELLDTAATETDTVVRRAELDRVRRNRRGAQLTAVAAVMVAVLTVLFVQGNFSSDSDPQPMEPVPGIDVEDVPVWYDDAGLHRGDVVERTPVKLRHRVGLSGEEGALALVRTGALYLDPASHDVWFHPWGGDPRIVGHHSAAGPGGDPNGDTAAWFEGTELVVYDTAEGREISRARMSTMPMPCEGFCVEHFGGNTILQVSADRVVWQVNPMGDTYSYDVQTGEEGPAINGRLLDVHDDAAIYWGTTQDPGGRVPDGLILKMPGRASEHHPELAHRGRFSPNGNYVLSVFNDRAKRSGAAILDTTTGEVWHVPRSGWPWLAWSYGDIALVDPEIWSSGEYRPGNLLACDAARLTCEALPAERPFLTSTN